MAVPVHAKPSSPSALSHPHAGSSRAPSRPHSRKPSDLPNSFSGGPPVPRHTASQMEASAPASSPSVIAAPSPDSSGAGHAAPAPRSSGPRSAMSLLGLGRDGAQDTSAVAASPKDATQTEALGKPSASSPQLGDVKGDGQDGAGSGGGWSILRGIVKTFSKKKASVGAFVPCVVSMESMLVAGERCAAHNHTASARLGWDWLGWAWLGWVRCGASDVACRPVAGREGDQARG